MKKTGRGKPPSLPKLPRTGSGKARSGEGRLPPMPRSGRLDLPIAEPQPDEVIPSKNNIGGTETGRWFDTTQKDGMIGGRCGKCGRLRKAENLELYKIPFTSDEQWQCKGGCY